ncbi:hypothetical protein [Altererythrobacter sp. Z27]|uniref:hypothetical protein n=1 Tax=Altererythrobacter sp. Z27 TaxID=3461147 RepID=UPI004043B96B
MTIAETSQLQASVRNLKLAVTVLACLLIVLLAAGFAAPQDEVIRTKGIVIEDSEGRARILIGAPAPTVAERLRTNLEKRNESFSWLYRGGDTSPMAGLDNDVFGMLVIDENGHDRVAVGGPVPDPLNGVRIGNQYGITFADVNGLERGGFGLIKNKEGKLDRVVMGMDSKLGEGAGILVDSDGSSGLFVNDQKVDKRLFSGVAPAGSMITPNSTERRLGTVVVTLGSKRDSKYGDEIAYRPAGE